MKKLTLIAALSLFGALGMNAQILFPPGELAVFKAGDNTGIWNISTSRVQPCFVQVFDTVTNNQSQPLYSLDLPTNAPDGIWINDHAGSEGGGISRAANRQYLAIQGYTGDILSPTNAKPSSDTNVTRGFGVVDVFGNEHVIYSDLANWFGLPPGVTQNNPTGIATSDGVNFWGTGNVTGTSAEASGTLFFNDNVSATPIELQNYIQAAAEARIIGGTLYIVVPGSGVYNFLDPQNNNAVVPLPYDPSVPNSVSHIVLTNQFLSWGSTFQNIANFDMNAAGTIAYGADQQYGIVKFVNSGGAWQPAPYYFSTTNIGTSAQAIGNQGCFGICVDFSGPNPIIYATTMENGTTPPNNSQGNANQNRIISIVDTGVNPGTNLVAQTLATATTTNESFRGIDFTPEVIPLITSEPSPYSTAVGGTASFSVTAQSVYPLTYQWLQNSNILSGQTGSTLTLSGVTTSLNMDEYQCVVSNAYGAVTSMPPATLTVALTPQPPVITNTPATVTNFVGGQVAFAPISPTGTEPFTFQWYFAGAPLSDAVKYAGSLTSSLTISNLAPSDAGSYYLVASNSAGATSNIVDVLSVQYFPPTVTAGEPASAAAFVGQFFTLTATAAGGTPPLTYQWYDGTTALQDANEYSGSATATLTINPISSSDAGSYMLVISNPGGSVTSQVATVTVLAPPAPSFVAYSNQVYAQNFDSLPDPGSNSVNSINNPHDPGSINGIAYSLANPFDFAYPVITSSYLGGLGLSSTMPGWYGAADTLYVGVFGISRFGAQDGDQTTGGVIDFGLNDSSTGKGTNRALGLLSTSTTGSTTFAVKLVNETTSPITNVSLSFTGELWHNGTGSRVMSFGYAEDSTATNFTLTAESITNSVQCSNLFFSFPTASVGAVDGTQSSNQVALATNNMALASPWTPGGAIWLIWSIDYYGSGSGSGYGIDNLVFSNASPPAPSGPPGPSYVSYTTPASTYTQDFDSLPYQPTSSVNTANPVTINSVIYSLADPFEFAASVEPTGTGGLGLSNTMPGWYGLGNAVSRFGATAGDQTTGGVLSFGPTNNATAATNRSLGLVSTSSTGPTAFGVRFLNLTGSTLGQINLSYSSELWRETSTAKGVTNFYYVDLTGTKGFITNIVNGSLTNITFATGSTAWGTNGPVSSNYVVFTNQTLATDWPPGAALWVIWAMNNSAGSAQGLGIDNLAFSADLATNLAPVITTEPQNQVASVGSPASFTVAVSNLFSGSYLWYTNGVPLANGNEFSGATTATLSINPAALSDAANYTVVISNIYGSATSVPVSLTVNSTAVAPGFSVQPQSQTNFLASNVVFSASVIGTQPISYQWQFDGTNIAGATTNVLTLTNLTFANSGTYTLDVNNIAGTNVSQAALLTVEAVPPTIVTEPSSQTVAVGGTAIFSVAATGSAPLQYQWMVGASPLSDGFGIIGSQSNILTLTDVQYSEAGDYTVKVSNVGGSSNSGPASLVVGPAASFVAYSNAAAVYTQDFDSLPYQPTNSVNSANPATINGVTYSLDNPFDFAFSEETTGAGGLGLSNSMPGWYGLGNSAIKFGATAGDQTTGGVLSFGSTNDPVSAANRALGLISTSSTGPTAFGVRFLNLTGLSLGEFNLAYTSELWRQTSTAKSVTNFYYVDLTGTNGFLTNIVGGSLTNLTFATGSTSWGTNGPVSSNYVVFTNQSFASNWPPGAALWVIWEMDNSAGSAQGIGIDDLAFSADPATNLAPVITTEPQGESVFVGASASFTVVVSNLFNGGFQWFTNGVALSDGNEFSGSKIAALTINPASLSDSADYTVVISNAYGSVTSTPAVLTVNSTAVAPGFSAQPQSATVFIGSDAIIAASVTGTQPISYQWEFDGTNIIGATSEALMLDNVGLTNAGTYTLAVANAAGTNLSQPATLTVVALAPSIVSDPSAQTVVVGGTASFSVSATGTAPLQYQWMLGATPLSDSISIAGSQSNTLTLNNVQFSEAGSYMVVVSNAGGSSLSTAAILTVVPGPSYVAYSSPSSIYAQNFDSLPYQPTSSVNTANPVAIDGENYSLGDPFDFAFPAETNGAGGLGLSNTMAGWYGLGNSSLKFGATAGDQTTGGVLSFGPTNSAVSATNRSLGLIATSSTGPTAFGVRFLNLTGGTLSRFSLAYSSELWRETATAKTVTNFYYLDLSGTNGFVTNIVSGWLTNLTFATGSTIWGTNGPITTSSVALTDQALTTNWPAGAALWVIWEMDNSAGSGQGIGIDNLTFSAGSGNSVQLNITETAGNALVWWPASGGTNLQVTSDLTQHWISAGLPVTTAGSTNSVTVPIGVANQYFRLSQ